MHFKFKLKHLNIHFLVNLVLIYLKSLSIIFDENRICLLKKKQHLAVMRVTHLALLCCKISLSSLTPTEFLLLLQVEVGQTDKFGQISDTLHFFTCLDLMVLCLLNFIY